VRNRSPQLVVFMTVFIDLLGFGIVIPLLPFYTERLGGGPFAVGLMVAAYSLMQALFTPIMGAVSDRVGRRRVLLLSLVGSVASQLFSAFAPTLPLFILARALAGVAGGNIAVAQAYVADITTPERRARGMGMIGAAIGLGFVFGPAIGGAAGLGGLSMPFFVAAGFATANLILAFFLLPETCRAASVPTPAAIMPVRRVWSRGLVIQLTVAFLFNSAFVAMETIFALFTQRRFGYRVTQNGWLFAYVGVLLVAMQGGLIGRLVGRVGERAALAIGLALMAAGLLLLPPAHALWLLLVALGLLSLGDGATTPANASLISFYSGADRQGLVLGVGQAVAGIARITGPLWAGAAFADLSAGAPLLIGGLAMLAALALIVACGLRRELPAGMTASPTASGQIPAPAGRAIPADHAR
jgi:DHA1 family tetracycline resistance protein-like MFS transporter